MIAGSGTRVVPALSIAAVLLLGTTACGTDTDGGAGAEPLSRAQLVKAALTQGDVSGYTVRDVASGRSGTAAGVDKEACQPIVDVLAPQGVAYEDRLVRRDIVAFSSGTERAEASYHLALFAAKSDAAADEVVQDVKEAVSACGDGFEAKLPAQTYKVRQVTLNESDFGTGSADFSIEYQMGMKRRFVVISSGASLSVFEAANQFDNAFVAVPHELVAEQKRKLATARS